MIDTLATLVSDAIRAAADAGEITLSSIPEPAFERPRDPSHGDWATNVAMRSAKEAGMPPRQIAEAIAGKMEGHPDIEERTRILDTRTRPSLQSYWMAPAIGGSAAVYVVAEGHPRLL